MFGSDLVLYGFSSLDLIDIKQIEILLSQYLRFDFYVILHCLLLNSLFG